MNKGKLQITKNKKGKFQVTLIRFNEKKGKDVPEVFSGVQMKDDIHNGKNVIVERDSENDRRILKIFLDNEDKLLIYSRDEGEVNKKLKKKDGKKGKRNSENKSKSKLKDSYNSSIVMIPNDSKKVLRGIGDVDNFNLKLNKFARHEIEDRKTKFKFFESKNYSIRPNFGEFENSKNIEILHKRQQGQISNLKLKEIKFEGDSQWRIIVGLGHESVYETNISLHHIYGIPYIPASSIKGLVRSTIIIEEFDSDEEAAFKDDGFVQIFGDTDHKGSFVYFDAFPLNIKPENVVVDIMNPHFGKYYNSKVEFPADYLNPVPIPFFALQDVNFLFRVGIHPSKNNIIEGNRDIEVKGKFENELPYDVIKKWLSKSLKEQGIGAKSSVGYGFFN